MPNSFSARISSTPEPAAAALVGERGVHEAVEQDGLAGVQQRPELLGDELRPRGGVEQRLGARVDGERRIGDERPDPLGQLDPAGLAQHRRAELAGEPRDQRRLAGAVEALDRDQHRPESDNAVGGRVLAQIWHTFVAIACRSVQEESPACGG